MTPVSYTHLDVYKRQVRFATDKPRRRPFNKPKLEEGKVSQARIVRYLCALISRDDSSLSINDAQRQYSHEISDVIDALWETLTGDEYKILQVGQRLDDSGKFVYEKDNAPRFNLNDLCFKPVSYTHLDVYKRQPTSESIRKAYIQEFLKRKADAEAFANFTETELATFIRKYDSANFSGIYECLDHNFYDRVRDKIAITRKMAALDEETGLMYSIHLKTY